MSLRWSSYVAPKSRGSQKRKTADFRLKSHFAWRKSATKFLSVKTVSDKVVRHSFNTFAGRLCHSGWRKTYNVRKMLSPSSSLPPLAKTAAWSLCDSWASCITQPESKHLDVTIRGQYHQKAGTQFWILIRLTAVMSSESVSNFLTANQHVFRALSWCGRFA